MNTTALTQDASNRALRTFLQALGGEVLLQIVPALFDLVSDETVRWDLNVVQSLIRMTVLASLSFIMRRYLDTSRIPTPLPPTPQPEPATPDPAP